MNTPKAQPPDDVPAGCQELPGYILDVFDGSAWITQDGQVTDKWQERGIWPTREAAAEMMHQCLSPNGALCDGDEPPQTLKSKQP